MEITKFIDKWNMIDKTYLADGGDSAAKTGAYFSLMGMLSPSQKKKWEEKSQRDTKEWFDAIVPKYHPTPGVILRHINTEWDSSDFDRHSRDQIQPNIIAFGYWSERELRRMAWGHLKRGFIFTGNVRQNGATKRNHGKNGYSYAWRFPDITGPEVWGNFIRSYRAWLLWPALLLFDLELLGSAINWRFFKKNNIAINHTLSQLQALDRLPTPWAWLASKIMPVPRLIELCRGHWTDFGVGEDTEFLADMMQDAYSNIRK